MNMLEKKEILDMILKLIKIIYFVVKVSSELRNVSKNKKSIIKSNHNKSKGH